MSKENLFIAAQAFKGRLNLDGVSGVENEISKADFVALYDNKNHEIFTAENLAKFALGINDIITKGEDSDEDFVSTDEVIDILKSELKDMKTFTVVDGDESKKFWVRKSLK